MHFTQTRITHARAAVIMYYSKMRHVKHVHLIQHTSSSHASVLRMLHTQMQAIHVRAIITMSYKQVASAYFVLQTQFTTMVLATV